MKKMPIILRYVTQAWLKIVSFIKRFSVSKLNKKKHKEMKRDEVSVSCITSKQNQSSLEYHPSQNYFEFEPLLTSEPLHVIPSRLH